MPTGIIITGVALATRKAFAFAYFKAMYEKDYRSGERAKRASAFINPISERNYVVCVGRESAQGLGRAGLERVGVRIPNTSGR